MPVGELRKIVSENPLRHLNFLRLLLSFELKQKTLTQITGTDPGWLELLNHLQHPQHLFRT